MELQTALLIVSKHETHREVRPLADSVCHHRSPQRHFVAMLLLLLPFVYIGIQMCKSPCNSAARNNPLYDL